MTTVQVEKRKRGIFGWIIAIIFWSFNLIMIAWLAMYWGLLGEVVDQTQDTAAKAGAVVGGAIGTGMVFSLWFFGAVILGLMMFFTRGKKVTITREVSD
jgi:hypothetical protein